MLCCVIGRCFHCCLTVSVMYCACLHIFMLSLLMCSMTPTGCVISSDDCVRVYLLMMIYNGYCGIRFNMRWAHLQLWYVYCACCVFQYMCNAVSWYVNMFNVIHVWYMCMFWWFITFMMHTLMFQNMCASLWWVGWCVQLGAIVVMIWIY